MSDLKKLQDKEREKYKEEQVLLDNLYKSMKSLETSKKLILRSFNTLREELRECESELSKTHDRIRELEDSSSKHYRLTKCKTIDQFTANKYSDDKYELYDEKGSPCKHPSYLDDASIVERCGCI